ncbi:hypothetical protein [Saliphagus infecundisoli]|uniref:Uncharacterized protein n=1 Tax=Saliphagus infecundisoli TaxID=1849069 RepID=A0ABD5QCG3_9EURY|nr:hypothetical protein [Saliphagus infecundisoli]
MTNRITLRDAPDEFRTEDAPFIVWKGEARTDIARPGPEYPLLEIHIDNGVWKMLKMFRAVSTGDETASIELPTEVVGRESFETGAAAFKRARELLPNDPHYPKATADPETDAEGDTTTVSDNAGNIKSGQDEAETGGSDEQRSLTDW